MSLNAPLPDQWDPMMETSPSALSHLRTLEHPSHLESRILYLPSPSQVLDTQQSETFLKWEVLRVGTLGSGPSNLNMSPSSNYLSCGLKYAVESFL